MFCVIIEQHRNSSNVPNKVFMNSVQALSLFMSSISSTDIYLYILVWCLFTAFLSGKVSNSLWILYNWLFNSTSIFVYALVWLQLMIPLVKLFCLFVVISPHIANVIISYTADLPVPLFPEIKNILLSVESKSIQLLPS